MLILLKKFSSLARLQTEEIDSGYEAESENKSNSRLKKVTRKPTKKLEKIKKIGYYESDSDDEIVSKHKEIISDYQNDSNPPSSPVSDIARSSSLQDLLKSHDSKVNNNEEKAKEALDSNKILFSSGSITKECYYTNEKSIHYARKEKFFNIKDKYDRLLEQRVFNNTESNNNNTESNNNNNNNNNRSTIDYVIEQQQCEMPSITESDGGE
jgi:uncharacterized protein YyaL (SSP411 family)